MSWPKVKLGDCCEIISGATPKTGNPDYWGGDIPWVSPKSLSKLESKYLDNPTEYITQAGFDSCSTRMLPAMSLLLSCRAPVGLTAINREPICTNQGFKSLIPNPEMADINYLFHVMKEMRPRLEAQGRGATFTEVSKSIVERFEIPLPPLNEQRRIATILDKAEEIKKNMKPITNLRHSLVISTFYTMFNIGKDGKYDWPSYTLNELVLPIKGSMRDGPFGSNLKSSDFVENGVKVIRTQNLKKTGYVDQNVAYISSEKAEELAKYEFEPGDLVIAKLGKYPGVAAVIPESCGQGIIPADIVRFRGKPELINHYYLAEFLNSAVGTRQISKHFRGSTRTRVNLTALREIKIAVPPLELQEEFERIVDHIKAIPSGELLSNLSSKSIYQEMLT